MSTAVPSRAESRKAKLLEWLRERGEAIVDEAAFEEIRSRLAPVSESYLRSLLRHSGARLDVLVEGANTHSFEDLERTLCALSTRYAQADAAARRRIRRSVIEAKDRLRWSMRGLQTGREEKEEMLLWLMTWLENPEVFAVWLRLRTARRQKLAPPHDPAGAS